jgi:hypothetical protein
LYKQGHHPVSFQNPCVHQKIPIIGKWVASFH